MKERTKDRIAVMGLWAQWIVVLPPISVFVWLGVAVTLMILDATHVVNITR